MPPLPQPTQNSQEDTVLDRIGRLESLLSMIQPLAESDSDEASAPSVICRAYSEVINNWRKAMRWTDGLDCALVSMLSSVMSTNLVGEQLWFQIIGPPSCGKTTLMEGISTNKKYVISKDTIRGFYSGWRDDSGDDTSLVAQAMGKTLAMKEGDAFIKSPNVQQILSEGRGIYDRVGRNHYRNATANEYEGVRMTWIICGTSAIREEIDSSELGARFLTCVVMDGIDSDFEDDVLWRAVNQESQSMLVESNCEAGTHHPEMLSAAMASTGAYVSYLRENATTLVSQVLVDEDTLRFCGRLGKFIAFMRARPSKKNEHPEREFAPRLGKQMIRLALSIAAVMNKTTVDSAVLAKVKKIGLDTARGLTLTIVDLLASAGSDGLEQGAVVLRTNRPNDQVSSWLRFLKSIGAVELKLVDVNGRRNASKRFVLSAPLLALHRSIR